MTEDHPELVQPAGAPDQKTRVLDWLRTHPDGLTQLQALGELAVARLAAVVLRLRADGHPITTELVELPTRYGPATVARYHLAVPRSPTDQAIAGLVGLYGKGATPGYAYAASGPLPTVAPHHLADALPGSLEANGIPVRTLGTGEVTGVVVPRASLEPVAWPADLDASGTPRSRYAAEADPWAEERAARAERARREAGLE